MPTICFDKIFPADHMSKRERVEATMNHLPVDRVALLEQLSHNPEVIAMYTQKPNKGFTYTVADIAAVIKHTLDLAMPPRAPSGTQRETMDDGLVYQHDNWTSWLAERPFKNEHGASAWLQKIISRKLSRKTIPAQAHDNYRRQMHAWQSLVGDTVILNYTFTGFCSAYNAMGLEIFTFFITDYPEVFDRFMQISCEMEVERVHAVADPELSPVILLAEDFATKQGPIFSPDFLREYHFPYVTKLTQAWHEHGVKVMYHSDGNWKRVIPELVACGVDGFYCLEKNCGMDIVELKNAWPDLVWSGGVDGVDLMERGTPEQVRHEVRHHIMATNALKTGGMFVASSSEINPTIPAKNFQAMVQAVDMVRSEPVAAAVGQHCNASCT